MHAKFDIDFRGYLLTRQFHTGYVQRKKPQLALLALLDDSSTKLTSVILDDSPNFVTHHCTTSHFLSLCPRLLDVVKTANSWVHLTRKIRGICVVTLPTLLHTGGEAALQATYLVSTPCDFLRRLFFSLLKVHDYSIFALASQT